VLTYGLDTILNPAAALQSAAEDFLESYAATPDLALSELVTCTLRCCGVNASITRDEATDTDGVVEKLDDLSEQLLQVQSNLHNR
jgi:cohesin complex subunit SA-1/2